MSISDWLLSALCVLGLIIAIQVGLVWRILSEFIGIANRIRDIGLEVFGIKSRVDTLIAHVQALISDSYWTEAEARQAWNSMKPEEKEETDGY